MAQAKSAEDDMREELARLRAEIAALARDRVVPAVEDAAETAGVIARGQVDGFVAAVRARPLLSVAIAGAIGLVLGRAVR